MRNITKKQKAEKSEPPFASAAKITRGIVKKSCDTGEKPMNKRKINARLSLAVSEWLDSPDLEACSPSLSEFSFTDPGNPIKEILKMSIEIDHLHDGDMVVKIPAFNPKKSVVAPHGTETVLCFGRLAVIDVSTGQLICVSDFPLIFAFKDKVYPEKIYKLKATDNEGNLTVVSISIYFHPFEKSGQPGVISQTSGLIAAIYRK